VTALLRQWKRDYASLLQRFDANGDGAIDDSEWSAVRKAAEAQVRREQRERFGERTVSLIARPPDGRSFIISTEDQNRLVRRWERQALLGFGAFVALAGFTAWAIHVR